jgi:hypothetical protein
MGAHGDCPSSAVAAGRYLGVLLHRPGLYPELRANSLDCAGPLENVGSRFLSLRQVCCPRTFSRLILTGDTSSASALGAVEIDH